jgi:hypothetical protein
MRYFLLVYDRRGRRLIKDVKEYPEAELNEAMNERFRIEREGALGDEIEVVVLGADSRERLEETHSRYFKSLDELAST